VLCDRLFHGAAQVFHLRTQLPGRVVHGRRPLVCGGYAILDGVAFDEDGALRARDASPRWEPLLARLRRREGCQNEVHLRCGFVVLVYESAEAVAAVDMAAAG
jgi:hypothetical protein